jgi:hypothetical protein
MNNFYSLNKKQKRGFAVTLVVAIIAIIALGVGIYVYNKNHSADKKQVLDNATQTTPRLLLRTEAADLAIQAVIDAKLTVLPKECLTTNINKSETTSIIFEVREFHGQNCNGDIRTAPVVATIQVNLQTKKVMAYDPVTNTLHDISSLNATVRNIDSEENNTDTTPASYSTFLKSAGGYSTPFFKKRMYYSSTISGQARIGYYDELDPKNKLNAWIYEQNLSANNEIRIVGFQDTQLAFFVTSKDYTPAVCASEWLRTDLQYIDITETKTVARPFLISTEQKQNALIEVQACEVIQKKKR